VVEGVASGLVFSQIKAIFVTLLLSVVATTILAFIVKAIVGLRPSEEVETLGLDLAEHGEEGYHTA
jgi:Amt family ammonium transporter